MKDRVWGVFARDELPRFLLPGGYVLNSDVRSSGGVHWLALFVTDEGAVEFMDSLGKHPTTYHFHMKTSYSTRRLQPLNSILCGMYVLYYLYWRTRDVPMHTIISTLNGDNDAIVQNHYVLM
jgi:hypothetical protein